MNFFQRIFVIRIRFFFRCWRIVRKRTQNLELRLLRSGKKIYRVRVFVEVLEFEVEIDLSANEKHQNFLSRSIESIDIIVHV